MAEAHVDHTGYELLEYEAENAVFIKENYVS